MTLESCSSSDLKSSSAVIYNRPAKLVAVTLIQAAAAATLIIYDNATTNSGKVLAQVNTTVNTSTNSQTFTLGVEAVNGLYAAVTGSGAGYVVHYAPM